MRLIVAAPRPSPAECDSSRQTERRKRGRVWAPNRLPDVVLKECDHVVAAWPAIGPLGRIADSVYCEGCGEWRSVERAAELAELVTNRRLRRYQHKKARTQLETLPLELDSPPPF